MKYNLSYTAASIRIHDTLLVAEAMLSDENYHNVDEQIGKGKTATGKRIRQELTKRLTNLTPQQMDYLVEAGLKDACKIAFLSICKTYDYIHQFVVEVLREKFVQFDYQVSDGEYITYYNRKVELHPELEALTESSLYKVKQVLFKILEEVGIIHSVRNKILQPQFLSPAVERLIRKDNPELLRIFFFSDVDIKQSPFLE